MFSQYICFVCFIALLGFMLIGLAGRISAKNYWLSIIDNLIKIPSQVALRPNKGCYTALAEIRKNFDAAQFMIEGDITGCFNNIKHKRLIEILRERINDERFIRLMYKLLKAGYLCEQTRQVTLPLNGTPQGSIISPLLCNIYMDKLDIFVEGLVCKYSKSSGSKARNPKGSALRGRQRALKTSLRDPSLDKLAKKQLVKELRQVNLALIEIPNHCDSSIKIYYVRYADDWIVGVNGPKAVANKIYAEIQTFLYEDLGLELSKEKTLISDLRKSSALFLGYKITLQKRGKVTKVTSKRTNFPFLKGTTGHKIKLLAPMERIVKRLYEKGYCLDTGFPMSNKKLTSYDDYTILMRFNSVRRGIINYYCLVDNSSSLCRVDYILRYSAAKTLAHKHKTSMSKIFTKHKKLLYVEKESFNGKVYKTSMPKFKAFKPLVKPISTRDPFQTYANRLTNSKLDEPCAICGRFTDVESHHIKHDRERNAEKLNFNALLSRKQIPVCRKCHDDIHHSRYDGIKLSKINPKSPVYFRKEHKPDSGKGSDRAV
jgi:hypothetical protein